MFIKRFFNGNKLLRNRAQAMVEFAIALPILLALLVGIFEVGRMVFIYSAVNNASREAARYGSAVGLNDSGTSPKYQDCDGIRSMAKRSAYFMNLADADITISYDHGPGSGSPFDVCPIGTTADPTIQVNTLADPDRIVVTVTSTYSPMVTLLPISSRPITSSSARTILGIIDLNSGVSSAPTGSGSPKTATATSTSAPTLTAVPATATATAIASATQTATSASIITFTPLPTNTITNTPTITPTATLTLTPSNTPTMTFTPTSTSTPVPGCSNITAGSITISNKTMSMTITNPHTSLTVSSVQVIWNSATGGPGGSGSALTLQSASLGGNFWTGSNSSGNLTIIPSSTVIPGNNRISTIIFTFDKNYQHTNGSESITISLSTTGCEGIQIKKP